MGCYNMPPFLYSRGLQKKNAFAFVSRREQGGILGGHHAAWGRTITSLWPQADCGLSGWTAGATLTGGLRPRRADGGRGLDERTAALTSGQRPRADGRLGGQRPWRFNSGLCERRPWRADGRQPRMSRWMTEPPSHVRWSTMDGRQPHETFASMRQCGFLAHLSLPRQNTSPVGLVCWSCFSYAQWSGVRQICFCIPNSV
jgi:hypothetical protein